MTKKSSMGLDILSTSSFVAAARVTGFIIPFAIAAVFGTNHRTDAFFLSFGLVLVVTLIIGHLFETLIVPYVTEAKTKGEDVGSLVGSIILRTNTALLLFIVVLLFALKPILALVTQFPPAMLQLSFELILVMAPMVFLVTCTSALNGALNAYRKFSVVAVSPAYRSVAVLIFVFAFKDSLGIGAAAWGFTCGEIIRCLVAYVLFQKQIGGLKFGFRVEAAALTFFKSASYQLLGFSFLYFIPVVSQAMATWLEPGDVSIFTLAERLRNVPFLIFTAGVASVVLSHWSNDYSDSPSDFKWHRIRMVFAKATGLATLGTFLLIVGREILGSLALGWGIFPEEKITDVLNLFCLFMAAFPFDVATVLCIRLIIILKKDAFYMRVTLAKLILMVGLNYVLMKPYGLMGIGAATAVMNVIYALVLFGYMRKHIIQLEGNSHKTIRHQITGASVKTKVRWMLSKLKRELFYFIQYLRGFRRHSQKVNLDRVLIGDQCAIPLEKWIPKTQEWERLSCLIKDSPYVAFLKAIEMDETKLQDDAFLEAHPYFKMGQVSIQTQGSYFGAQTPEGMKEQMRGFYQAYKNMKAGKELTAASEDYRRSEPGVPVLMNKISESDCYEIKDGHHRTAMHVAAGKQSMSALIVGQKSSYLQKLLYSGLQTKNTELYQPVERAEVASWSVLRQCSDRFEMMMNFLSAEGLSQEIKTVLDMPCSYGWFVQAFKGKGYQAVGMDRDPYSLLIGKVIYGLEEGELQQEEILNVFSPEKEQSYDCVLFLSILHHFAFHGEAGSETDILKKVDQITNKVLFLDSGQNHEGWFKEKLKHWDDAYLIKMIKDHTSFNKVVALGKDKDNRGHYENQYARTLFACVKS